MADLTSTIAELRLLLEAATPGPWTTDMDVFGHPPDDWICACVSGSDGLLLSAETNERNQGADRDEAWARARSSAEAGSAALIVAAHNHLPAILDALEAAEARVRELESTEEAAP